MCLKMLFQNFENAGYSVNQDGQLQHQLEYADIIAEKENRRYCIEVKYLQLRERAVDRICSMGKTHGMTPVAVVGSKIDDIRRNHYLEKYPDLILLDIAICFLRYKAIQNCVMS